MKKNKREKIIVITSYPPRDTLHGKGVGGLASFAKNILISLPTTNAEFTVLAEKFNGIENYEENSIISVFRIWERNSPKLYFQLIRELIKQRTNSSKLLIQFEFSIFGSQIITGFFPLILIVARLLNYDITLVLHQVVINIKEMSIHIGKDPESFETWITNILMRNYYTILTQLSNKIVVLDEIHKERLAKYVERKRVHTIPIGVEQKEGFEPKTFNPQDITITYFGFIAWYKGADWLLDWLNYIKQFHKDLYGRVHLVLAGGQSPTQKNSPSYQAYYKNITERVESESHVQLTGFVPEESIENIYLSSDIVVLPYRVLMSSSGPLSWAFTYEKPFFISENLMGYTKTTDLAQSLIENDMTKDDFVFRLNDFTQFTQMVQNFNKEKQGRFTKVTKSIRKSRDWKELSKKYLEVINQ